MQVEEDRNAVVFCADEILDPLSTLMECAGLLGSNSTDKDDNPWNRLAESLVDVVALLTKRFRLTQSDKENRLHDQMDLLLLHVEEATGRVRDDLQSLRLRIPNEIQSQLDRCHQLESCCAVNRSTHQLQVLFKAVAGAIRQQQATAIKSIQTIQACPGEIYLERKAGSTLKRLRRESLRIQQRCISKRLSPWPTVSSVLQHIATLTLSKGDLEGSNRQTMVLALSIPVALHINDQPSSPLSSNVSLAETINEIVRSDWRGKTTWSFLLVGSEGTGKTTLLNEIEDKTRAEGIEVIRPVLPFDALGATIGAAEDALISMVSYAISNANGCILLLDDVDTILGEEGAEASGAESENLQSGRGPHVNARLHTVLLTLLDAVAIQRSSRYPTSKLLLVCASKVNFDKSTGRFDRVFHLGAPDDKERGAIISGWMGDSEVVGSETLLQNIVHCTSGLSRSEIAQLCRQSLLLHQSQLNGQIHILEVMKQKLQASTPESLKSGTSDDFVDMKVFTARDLQRLFPIQSVDDPIKDLPLFGTSAGKAWIELRRLIVLPVCQADALNDILFCHGRSLGGRKVFGGGVLLASSPGTGKSSLAYFCASFASLLNQSVKLIDVSCTSLVHKEVGGSERALHRVFQIARAATPCIVVMDGIENIAAVRGNDNTTEGTMDRLLSTLLTELDGVDNQETGQTNSTSCLSMIGITHDHRWIDPALRRPGRLERVISLENPELEARKKIVLKELQGVAFLPDADNPDIVTLDDAAERVAATSEGFSGAGIVAICNEAKLLAFKSSLEVGRTTDDPCLTPSLLLQAIKAQRIGKSR